jgi:hypothetical protein
MTGPAADADAPPEPSDDAPRPWWVGHPVVKYPGIGLVWGTIIAKWQLEGDTEVLVTAPLMILAFTVAIWACAMVVWGRVPQLYAHWASPVAGIIIALALITVAATMLLDLAVNPPTDEVEWDGGFWIAGLLFVAGIWAQIMSLSPAWPDRWRPRREQPTRERTDRR